MRPLNWSVVCGASHSRCASAACPNVYANAGSGLPEPMAVSKTCLLGYGTNRCVCIISGIWFCISSLSNLTDSLIALTRDLRHCSNKRSGLRLDDETAVKAVRDGIVVVSPSDPAGSELIRRITLDDKSELMPPHETNKPLTEKEKQTLRLWIAEGAEWSQHWAYEAPVRYEVPSVKRIDCATCRAEIYGITCRVSSGEPPRESTRSRALAGRCGTWQRAVDSARDRQPTVVTVLRQRAGRKT